jgi:photosystem II stability/assembly factor-like uncharacterized protein
MRRVAVVLALLAATAASCGDDAPAPPSLGVSDGGVDHIHGLGVNPADRSLFIATHRGLFRAAPGQRNAERVGDRLQDTMGFTVVGPDQFLGSGHPDRREDLPPLLGLIRSNDAGNEWTPVSLLGEADFHVLRTSGPRLYGFDATGGRLMVSSNGGRSWAVRHPPPGLLDLAIDPENPDRIVASTGDGLSASRNAGESWRPLAGRDRAGMLAWTDALILIDAAGTVYRSDDEGRGFARAGDVGGRPAAVASHGRDLYVALHDNTVTHSRDGGRSWVVRAVP